MPRIHVCSLALLAPTVAATGARHLVTLINEGTPVSRPAAIPLDRHLFLGINDITEPQLGLVTPASRHVAALIEFAGEWDRAEPMVIHCYAGISRSTAAAFILACALAPERDERVIADELRVASPTATPNRLLVSIADTLLQRDGRMVAAIDAIGRGTEAGEGTPFSLGFG